MDTEKSIRIDPPGGIAGAVIAALWMAICLHCFIRMFEKYWAIGNRSYTNIRPCRSRRVGRLSRLRCAKRTTRTNENHAFETHVGGFCLV